jgi:hypothetical protein
MPAGAPPGGEIELLGLVVEHGVGGIGWHRLDAVLRGGLRRVGIGRGDPPRVRRRETEAV